MWMRYFFWVLIGVWLLPAGRVSANHLVGGHIEMKAVGDKPGHFHITVINYFDVSSSAAINATIRQAGGWVGIFRKSDNREMYRFKLDETGNRANVVYTNEKCAEQSNLKFLVGTFEADIYLTPSEYADAGGYYMSYQLRNRNGGVTNIVNPSETGYTFYLEFPALTKNGRIFENSSPHFSPINGEYLCLNEPFTFAFDGTDPDGDELRYTLVTPLDQKGANGANSPTNVVLPSPYPDVIWTSGNSALNAIPGKPGLAINNKTGQLSVTPTQEGLYVFAVNIEEYRNGTKIGEVRRDFQFLVLQCPPVVPPDPTVQINGQPTTTNSVTICQKQTATLKAIQNPDWNYQWRRNGINLTDASSSSMVVQDEGKYQLYVSLKTTCSKASSSTAVDVYVAGTGAKVFSQGHLCATSGLDTLTLKGVAPGVGIQWFQNGSLLAGRTLDTVIVAQPGPYYAQLDYTSLGCKAYSDTAVLKRTADVIAKIESAAGQKGLCPGDSIALSGSGGDTYSWLLDGKPIAKAASPTYVVSKAGNYVLTAMDYYGCTGTSEPFAVTAVSAITPAFDSIPTMCGTAVALVNLSAQPAGGTFSGVGVSGTQFDAAKAGVGRHTITYAIRAASFCPEIQIKRLAVVAPIPQSSLPDSMVTYRGNTFRLENTYTGNPNTYSWAPPTYLDDANAATPTVQSIQDNVTYILNVANASGCTNSDTIQIRVVQQLMMSNAFSPNNDGVNDVWVLRGIEAYPDVVVTIFNRWGEVVFRSERGYPKPFDGTYNGNPLAAGLYTYTIQPSSLLPTLKGQLMILR